MNEAKCRKHNLVICKVVLMIVLITAVISSEKPGIAGVVEYEEKTQWESAVGEFTTIGFTGYSYNTLITDQYLDQGVLFSDGDDTIAIGYYFYHDDRGLKGNGIITLSFCHAMNYIAVDFPGGMMIELYKDEELIYTSSEFAGPGVGHFAGLISSEQFDEVVLHDWIDGTAYIDDLHFGAYVPSAGGSMLFLFMGLIGRRRRKY